MAEIFELHKKLLSAVQARIDTVADHAFRDRDPQAHLAALKAIAATLDAEIAKLPSSADPMLRHYLERQSYTKALDWLKLAVSGASH